MLRSKPILLVEDDPACTDNIKCALDTLNIKSKLVHRSSGEDALSYLRNQINQMPWLVLWGLNEHGSDGFDFIKAIKSDDRLKIIPVVIIADSDESQDIVHAFELGIAGYIVKPRDISMIADKIKTVMNYWTLSELPPTEKCVP